MSTAERQSRTRFLDAALRVIREKGFVAATVDDLCAEARLTKGSFFHHFTGKEDLALAAADYFGARAEALFAGQDYRRHADPLERVLGYIDFRRAMLVGSLPDYTCLLGTMVQEVYATHPAIRAACERNISAHAATVASDIALAKNRYAPDAGWSPEEVGLFTQAVLQGAFILAKARNGPEVAASCVDHLRRYVECLFNHCKRKETAS